MSLPRVTVLIANRNYENYLLQAIGSTIGQTYSNIQICIIDDASTDKSVQVVNDFFSRFNDVKRGAINPNIDLLMAIEDNRKYTAICCKNNLGPSGARNIGIDVTLNETEIYAILDADDFMYPNKIERCVQKFLNYPDVGVVYANYDILNVATNNLIREYKWPFSRQHLLNECIVHSGSLIKKDVLLAIKEPTGYYDVNLTVAEDWDLWLRASEKCTVAHIPESLTCVRNHNQSSVYYRNQDTWNRCWHYVAQKTRMRNGQ